MKLDNTIAAVVTGAASGLGAATARALAGQGVKVALFDLNTEAGEALAAEVGGVFCSVDVTSDPSVDAGFERARAFQGQERILVNCAGIVVGRKTLSRDKTSGDVVPYPMETFERVIRVNLGGTFRCLSRAAEGMSQLTPLDDDERGVIINTSSVAGVEGQIGQAAYSASKGGVLALNLPVARDLAPEGIRVNAILPGIIQTPMMAGMPANVQAGLAASVPFPKRLGLPAEYASLVLEICRNGYINGEAIRLDGAIRLAPR
jgi:NAD(P)-dependent dehydrogenase (short-subunit alcohol dehydrogenase family)